VIAIYEQLLTGLIGGCIIAETAEFIGYLLRKLPLLFSHELLQTNAWHTHVIAHVRNPCAIGFALFEGDYGTPLNFGLSHDERVCNWFPSHQLVHANHMKKVAVLKDGPYNLLFSLGGILKVFLIPIGPLQESRFPEVPTDL
jgi:hypothetical protein